MRLMMLFVFRWEDGMADTLADASGAMSPPSYTIWPIGWVRRAFAGTPVLDIKPE